MSPHSLMVSFWLCVGGGSSVLTGPPLGETLSRNDTNIKLYALTLPLTASTVCTFVPVQGAHGIRITKPGVAGEEEPIDFI